MACLFSCCKGSTEKSIRGLFTFETEEDELRRQAVEREKNIVLHGKARRQHRQNLIGTPIDLDESYVAANYPKSEETAEFLDSALADPGKYITAYLEKEDRASMVAAMQKYEVTNGTKIIQQGEEGDYMYIVEEGLVEFLVDANNVGFCSRGSGFGELALLYDCPRAATCVARSDCKLWRLDRFTFKRLLAKHAHVEEQTNIDILKNFSWASTFDMRLLTNLADALTVVHFRGGTRIFSKGDPAKLFYIIRDGSIDVNEIVVGNSPYRDQTLGPGDYFGDNELVSGEPRAGNATTATDCTLLCLSQEDFNEMFNDLSYRKIINNELKKRDLLAVPIFHGAWIEPSEIDRLVESVDEICVRKGHVLEESGKPAQKVLYMIRYGKLLMAQEDGILSNIVAGGYYGDEYIKNDSEIVSSRTITAEENTCMGFIRFSDIVNVIGDMSRLRDPMGLAYQTKSPIQLRHLKMQRIIGIGGFGQVWLVRHKVDQTAYALKQLDKRHLIKRKQASAVIREKNIMASINHPFAVSLISCFQDEDHLYLVLELVQGGELFSRIQNNSFGSLPEFDATFYAGCVIEVLSYIHQRKICYRDLKPENVLIDSQGYCILVDFGFAKIVLDKTYTMLGTPEYLAPEIIMSKGHNHASDYWAFGVMVYEMLVGYTPFNNFVKNQLDLFKHIVLIKYSFPRGIKQSAKDLIERLLVRQSNRLGNHARGHLDVAEHKWFKHIDFEKLCKKEIPAPWVPPIENAFDAAHFERYSAAGQDRPVFQTPLSRPEQELFSGF